MSNGINELSKLNFDGKEWVTLLRNKLCSTGTLSPEDIDAAFGKLSSTVLVTDQAAASPAPVASQLKKTMYRLYGNKNILGLKDDGEIHFSPQMTVIYGKNGSGKSSFYRLLKDAFHSNQKLIGNIYNAVNIPASAKIDFVPQTAHLAFQKNGVVLPDIAEVSTIDWASGIQNDARMKFCDTAILSEAITKKNTGWSIDRYRLGYYDLMRNGIERVEAKVNTQLQQLSLGYKTYFDSFVQTLKASEPTSIKSELLLVKDQPDLLKVKLDILSSSSLSVDHEAKKAELLVKSHISISTLNTEIDLAKSRVSKLTLLVQYFKDKKKLLAKLGEQQGKIRRVLTLKESFDFSKFNSLALIFDPISNPDQYIGLIKKIAESALAFGYNEYLISVDKCFYCNQKLSDSSKTLIADIHRMVANEVNVEIGTLNAQLDSYIAQISEINQRVVESYSVSEIGAIYDIQTKQKVDCLELMRLGLGERELSNLSFEIKERKKDLSDLKVFWEGCDIISLMVYTEKGVLENKIAALIKELYAIDENRKKAKLELDDLEDLEYCVQQKVLIGAMVGQLEEILELKTAQSQFSGQKTKLSRDKGRVENELLRSNYIQKFNSFLGDFELKKRDRMVRPFSNPGGLSKVESKIEAHGNSFEVKSILSEGEAKVYALCDWFTELEFDESEILIFDDPITSLDQANIHKLVDRIAKLCGTYQVVVFTHNLEFYHRLVQKTLGGGELHKSKCEICDKENEAKHCKGLNTATGKTHKCSSYYQVEYILQPGTLAEDVMFLSLNWEQRMAILRENLLRGDVREADKHLRTSINNFFERFVLADMKRQVYKNNDLIKEYRKMRQVDLNDYDSLMEVHNKVSGEGAIHEPSPEVRSPLDVEGYIGQFNKAVIAINNIYRQNDPNTKDKLQIIQID